MTDNKLKFELKACKAALREILTVREIGNAHAICRRMLEPKKKKTPKRRDN